MCKQTVTEFSWIINVTVSKCRLWLSARLIQRAGTSTSRRARACAEDRRLAVFGVGRRHSGSAEAQTGSGHACVRARADGGRQGERGTFSPGVSLYSPAPSANEPIVTWELNHAADQWSIAQVTQLEESVELPRSESSSPPPLAAGVERKRRSHSVRARQVPRRRDPISRGQPGPEDRSWAVLCIEPESRPNPGLLVLGQTSWLCSQSPGIVLVS